MNEKKIIQELNVIFKQRGWELLPEDSNYNGSGSSIWGYLILGKHLFIDRDFICYETYLNKFTLEELDSFVMEYIKPFCKKYKFEKIDFSGRGELGIINSIKLT